MAVAAAASGRRHFRDQDGKRACCDGTGWHCRRSGRLPPADFACRLRTVIERNIIPNSCFGTLSCSLGTGVVRCVSGTLVPSQAPDASMMPAVPVGFLPRHVLSPATTVLKTAPHLGSHDALRLTSSVLVSTTMP